jgi:hypothetical protein
MRVDSGTHQLKNLNVITTDLADNIGHHSHGRQNFQTFVRWISPVVARASGHCPAAHDGQEAEALRSWPVH